MLVFLFWLSFWLLVFIYVGYPIVIGLLALANRHSIRKDDGYQPMVSILIAAFNEEADIEATLRNKIAQTYPSERMEILVVSDESEDQTDTIVSEFAKSSEVPVHLIRQTPRQGKTAGLNKLVPVARGEILVFSDANSCWADDAVAKLVRNFADPEVGYVTGKMVYTSEDGSMVGDGCSSYMKYENWLREKETALGSIVGVDGGVDAMRASLYEKLRADQLPDFVQPLMVVDKGYRVIYEPDAVLKEPALNDSDSEFSMRVRVTLRALWALKDMRHLMNPLRNGVFGFQMIVHKGLRYYAFVPLLLLAFCGTVLADAGVWYTLLFLGQVAFYGLAWQGHRSREKRNLPTFIGVPYYFCLLNFACMEAALAFYRGERKVTWNPRKG